MIDSSNKNLKDLSNNLLDHEQKEIDLVEFLAIISNGKWIIGWVTLTILLLGVAKAFLEQPTYKADVIMQVEEKTKTLIGMKQLEDVFQSNLPVLAEVELIKSRKVLGQAIKNLKLDIEVKPDYFPIIGELFSERFQDSSIEQKTMSNINKELASYISGSEVIQIDILSVPKDLQDQELVLEVGEAGYFKIIYENQTILEGVAGKSLSRVIQEGQEPLTIQISRLETNPGKRFIVRKVSEIKAINSLKENLMVSEKNKLTGILELTFESKNPELAVRIINEIANIYVQQNIAHKYAAAEQTLNFVEQQLPFLQKQKDSAVNALNEYKNRKGSIDFNTETSNILKDLVNLKTQVTLLQQKRDELRQTFTESHPNVIAVNKQIARLKEQIQSSDNKIKVLPETQQIILALSGDVEISTNLYNTLFDKAQALKVSKAGTVGDARVIDYALLPDFPIKPKKALIIAIALLIGLFSGIATVFIRKMLQRGMEDPDLIEKQLGVPVYATIAHSKNQEILNKRIEKAGKSLSLNAEPVLLARTNSEDIAIESLRSLRTSLHFSLLDAKNNIILISGPGPNIGKSFVAANLAAVVADSGKKVLLIDADLRKGAINKIMNIGREKGLSELILNTISIDQATRHIPLANVDFIPTGAYPPNPSELLLHERFGVFLETVSKQYDLVIIDSPPILAATDAAIISRFTSATFMVIKAGLHTRAELEQSIKGFSQSGVNIKGIVLNDIFETSSRYGYGYNRYAYQYSYKKNGTAVD